MTCLKVSASSKTGNFPCLRYKISEVKLYKQGQVPGHEWSMRWNKNTSEPIQEWASAETRVIQVSEGYSDRVLELRVRRFVPQDGDKLERSWAYNGEKRTAKIPPFALIDLGRGKTSYVKYIRDSMDQAFDKILSRKRSGKRDERRGMLYQTYIQAVKHCELRNTPEESKDVLLLTFRLWMAIRLSTKSVFIVGEDTLGMSRDILDETSGNPGKIPLPPVLGAQLDVILIHHIQSNLRRQVLEKVEKMVSKRQLDTWMGTYLVTFMLLHNASLIIAHDKEYAKKHGMKVRISHETNREWLQRRILRHTVGPICPCGQSPGVSDG